MRVSRIVPVTLLLTVFFSAFLLGQTRTTGSLMGQVIDTTGAAVANARVILTGPFGSKTMETNDHGAFLFPNLIPDTHYHLHAELAGFQPSDATDVEVRIEQTATAKLILQPNEAAATGTVLLSPSSLSPIDEGGTTIGANIPDRLFQAVPIQRTLGAIVQMAPSVANGKGTGTENPAISGATGLENMTIIDGVDVTNPQFGANGTFNQVQGPMNTGVNFDFIKDVDVQTGGFEAQYGQAMGGVVDVATKSGGNEYHGGIYQYYAPNALEATRMQPNAGLLNPGIEDHGQANYDLAGELGGYFFHDKVFWYGGINPVFTLNDVEAPMGYELRAVGKVQDQQRSLEHSLKFTFQPGQNHQIEASYFADPSDLPLGFHQDLARDITTSLTEANSKVRYGSRNVIVRYNGTLTPHFTTSLSVGRMFNKYDQNDFADEYEIQNLLPVQFGYGGSALTGGIGAYDNTRMADDQLNWTNSINGHFIGKSSFVFGYNLEREQLRDSYNSSGDPWNLFPTSFTRAQDVGLPMFGTQLTETLNTSGQLVYEVTGGMFSPSASPYTDTHTRYNAAFAEETFSLSRYVTLKGGVRWEQQAILGDPATPDPNSHHVFTGNWAPRGGFTIDPTGKNKTKLFFNYGRFYEKIPLDLAARALSGQGQYLGMQFSSPVLSAADYLGGGFLSSGTVTPFAPNARSQFEREYLAGAEQSFTNYNVRLGIHFVRRDMERVLEDMGGTSIESELASQTAGTPIPLSYVIGNPTAGTDLFGNGTGVLGSDGTPDGFVNPIRRYWAWEFTADKRFEEVWEMQASYRIASLKGNYEGLYRDDNFTATPNFSTMYNFPLSAATSGLYSEGPLPTDERHVANFYLAHTFPEYGWNLGVGARMNTGTPITGLAPNPVYLMNGDLPVGTRGSYGRTPTVATIDGHADYTWNLSDRIKLRPNVDVFNVLNQQHIINVDQDLDLFPGVPNADFGKALPMSNARSPMAFERPVSARLALRLEF